MKQSIKNMVKNISIIKYILLLFAGWRIALLFVTFLGLSTFPHADPVKYELFHPRSQLEYWTRWSNWDGGHYRSISDHGYQQVQTVFFPLYPLLIKLLTVINLSSFWSGFLISQITTLVAMFYLYKLTLEDFDEQTARRAVLVLLVFPTSFYLVSVYNESLFLALTLASFYYARINHKFISSILAGFSAVTRLIGLAVIAGVFFNYFFKEPISFKLKFIWQTRARRMLILTLISIIVLNLVGLFFRSSQLWFFEGISNSIYQPLNYILSSFALFVLIEWVMKNINLKMITPIYCFYMLISFAPFILYLFYQYKIFGSFLTFLTSEAVWQKSLASPWQGPVVYYQHLASRGFIQTGDSARILFEFLLFILLLVVFIISVYKLKPVYTVYYFFALLIPLLSGTLLDLPRYTLTIFPIFMILGQVRNEVLQNVGFILSTLLLATLSILYINNYWFM